MFFSDYVTLNDVVNCIIQVRLKTVNVERVIVENGTVGYGAYELDYHEQHNLRFLKIHAGTLYK